MEREKYCILKNNEKKKVSIYLIESPSRENYSDFQVRVYGDGETSKDIRFKYENFSTRNTETAFEKANQYYEEQKEKFLELGMTEKVGLIKKIIKVIKK